MTKDLLTQAAQKEAEGLYPGQVTPYVLDPETTYIHVSPAVEAARAAHVKCALLYSERAAGLVEAGNKLRIIAYNPMSFYVDPDPDDIEYLNGALSKWDAALTAFNSQT